MTQEEGGAAGEREWGGAREGVKKKKDNYISHLQSNTSDL